MSKFLHQITEAYEKMNSGVSESDTHEKFAPRVRLLEAMNTVATELNDENSSDEWLTVVPDGMTEDDAYGIASNEEEWNLVCKLFCNVIASYGKESGFAI